jgi:hypothetical protein
MNNEDPTIPARIPDAIVKQNSARPLAGKSPGKAQGDPRIMVSITRCGPRALDRDNLYGSVKHLVDACRRAGLIPGDSVVEIELQVEQQRAVKTPKGIGTILEIEWP